jgi:hypothetical protein
VQRTENDHIGWVLGDRTIKRSSDNMCGLHRARGDEERMFLCLASKPRSTVCQWFDLKIIRTSFLVLASKPTATFW